MRITMKFTCAVVAVGLLAGAMPLTAHHAFSAAFDENRPINLQGVITKVELVNPHSWIWLDVKDKDGKVTTWGFEAEGPTTLQRAGIRPSDFRAGTKVTMTGRPMKNGQPAATWELAVREDGKKFNPREGFQVK